MASDAQLRDAMTSTMTGFAALVAELEPQHWDQPTPCPGWSVFDVVDHVVAGERFTELTLRGASVAEAAETPAGIDTQNPNVVAQVKEAAAMVLTAFDGSLDRVIQHRIGPVSARRVLGFRIIDQLGHTWDVATAIGRTVVLDPDALAVGVEVARAERETLERSPNFATLPEDQGAMHDAQTTFLRAIGRMPATPRTAPTVR